MSLLDLCKIISFIELYASARIYCRNNLQWSLSKRLEAFFYDRLIRESKPNDIIKGIANQYLPWFSVKHVNSIISLSIALMIQILVI